MHMLYITNFFIITFLSFYNFYFFLSVYCFYTYYTILFVLQRWYTEDHKKKSYSADTSTNTSGRLNIRFQQYCRSQKKKHTDTGTNTGIRTSQHSIPAAQCSKLSWMLHFLQLQILLCVSRQRHLYSHGLLLALMRFQQLLVPYSRAFIQLHEASITSLFANMKNCEALTWSGILFLLSFCGT